MEWVVLAGVVGTALVLIVMKMERVFANSRAWKELGNADAQGSNWPAAMMMLAALLAVAVTGAFLE